MSNTTTTYLSIADNLARYQKLEAEQPSVKTATAYYKAHIGQYMTPESAKLQYAELRLDQLAAQVKVSDEDLKAAYEKNKDRYNEPEKRHGRHILMPIGKDDAAGVIATSLQS